ncbi:MAG: bifunctional 3,4-dihydroxy-2-butanone-4-phosphate synthase/GTP cyclohydrolase II [Pseudomonadota bacterium]
MTGLNSIEEIIDDLKAGRMVILMDDESRENEGDLVMPAERVSADDINFMARYGRGLICLTLTQERCRQLRLPLMVGENGAAFSTNFTLSIEASEGVTTGISAADRARTIQAAVAPDARPEDIVQPGHIFPIMARPGGVLARAGHTEAGCDLALLAGYEPAATIVEILNDDGSMARRPDLEVFASEHNLKIGTIDDLIRYRMANERTVERVAECQLDTEHGPFQVVAYQDVMENGLHLALVRGAVDDGQPVLVRVQVEDLLSDSLGAITHGSWSLRHALRRVSEEGRGVVLLVRPPQQPGDLARRIQQVQLGGDAALEAGDPDDNYRTLGIGAQILSDLGIHSMRLLSSPKTFHGLAGFDLEITEFVAS